MQRRSMGLLAAAVAVMATAVAGCLGPGPVQVPAGGHEVHLRMDNGTIAIAPDTVPAGDVYLVIDTDNALPVLASASRLSDVGGIQPELGFDDVQLGRVLAGDAKHTTIASGFPAGGAMGRITRLNLGPGKHLFLTRDIDGRPFGTHEVAVLTVTP